jgi:hypothetical protein
VISLASLRVGNRQDLRFTSLGRHPEEASSRVDNPSVGPPAPAEGAAPPFNHHGRATAYRDLHEIVSRAKTQPLTVSGEEQRGDSWPALNESRLEPVQVSQLETFRPVTKAMYAT